MGLQLYKKVKELKGELSREAWSLYSSALKTSHFLHYQCFEVAFNVIKQNASQEGPISKKVLDELENCNELKDIIYYNSELAKYIEEFLLKILSGPVPDKIFKEFHTLKLHRASLELFYNFHNTKFLYFLHKHIGAEKVGSDIVKKYSEFKEKVPLSVNNRKLIKRLSENKFDEDILYFMEVFDSLKNLILQLVFEAHYNIVLEVEPKYIVRYREKKINQIRVFKSVINKVEQLMNSSFICLNNQENNIDIGLIYTKIIRNIGTEDCRGVVTGIMYPSKDHSIFSKGFNDKEALT
ncbi:hypothetical protein M8R20_20120 [Pseudomonas sp. R2.Fl]|nr:hypothetical protein [Pseudomonas sp. R2.Fl]